VINTHAHFDHLLGNAAFTDSGAQFVGHQELPATVAASEDFFSSHFAAERAGDKRPLLPLDGV
jgi:glyoxylase-like metal-dependent hydrolase (beta-lactamase superfamily II)